MVLVSGMVLSVWRLVYSLCAFHVVASDDLTWAGSAFAAGSFGAAPNQDLESRSGSCLQLDETCQLPEEGFPDHPLCANIQLKTNHVFKPVKKY